MKSIWQESIDIPEREALAGDLSVEAAVIGGGLAGILIAYFLKENGLDTVVLEADRIGCGQTKGTTAKITVQHGLIFDQLISQFGLEQAKKYAKAQTNALSMYRKIVAQQQIDCEFVTFPSYLYSTAEAEPIEREAAAAVKLGLEAEFTVKTTLPFAIAGAVCIPGQAAFHPLKFLAAVSQGLRVYEQTAAIRVEGDTIFTNRGKVKAKHIVFATHYPFVNAPGYYFMKMHQERSYVLALEQAASLDGMYRGIDQDGLSFRNSGELLLLGGSNHRTGENSIGGQYGALRTAAGRYFPQSREAAHWSAQDCMTRDGVPYIGRFARSRPDWYVATGFGKWGMTNAMVAAMLLSDRISGKRNRYASVFSPQRELTVPAAKHALKDGMQAVKGLGRRLFALPKEQTNALSNGQGGVVEYEGEKCGVYKDENGKCFVVDIRCPHLGCQLEWNPDERSWDCPCHGSRFDYQGNLIDSPAQKNIEVKAE